MPQKDDLLARLSAELSAALQEVSALGDGGRFAEALALLEASYRRHTGSEAFLLRSLAAPDLLALSGAGGTLNVERCLAVAELLYAEAALRKAQGDAPSEAEAHKLAQLYGAALSADETLLEELGPKLQGLGERLEAAPKADLWRQLFALYARAGRYDEAENWLYRLLAISPGDAPKARAFYEGLLALPDEALEAGGLPRDEVHEGLAEVAGEATP